MSFNIADDEQLQSEEMRHLSEDDVRSLVREVLRPIVQYRVREHFFMLVDHLKSLEQPQEQIEDQRPRGKRGPPQLPPRDPSDTSPWTAAQVAVAAGMTRAGILLHVTSGHLPGRKVPGPGRTGYAWQFDDDVVREWLGKRRQ